MNVEKDIEKLKKLTNNLKNKAKEIHSIQCQISGMGSYSWLDLEDIFEFRVGKGVVYIETLKRYGDNDDYNTFEFDVALFEMTNKKLYKHFKDDLDERKQLNKIRDEEDKKERERMGEEHDIKEFRRLKRKFGVKK